MNRSNYKRTQDASEQKRFSGEHAIAAALWQIALTYASVVDIQTGITTPSSVSSKEMISQALYPKEER